MCVCGILLAYWNSWMVYCGLQNKELTNQAINLKTKCRTLTVNSLRSLVLYAGRCSDKHTSYTKRETVGNQILCDICTT